MIKHMVQNRLHLTHTAIAIINEGRNSFHLCLVLVYNWKTVKKPETEFNDYGNGSMVTVTMVQHRLHPTRATADMDHTKRN